MQEQHSEEMGAFLRSLLAPLLDVRGQVRLLTQEQSAGLCQALIGIFPQLGDARLYEVAVTGAAATADLHLTIGAMEPARIREALRSAVRDGGTRAFVLWPRAQCGVALSCRTFVEYSDDLWYRARDDVWVADEALSWWLVLTHEEHLVLLRRP